MNKLTFLLFGIVALIFFSCSRNEKPSEMTQARLQVALTDSPFPDAKEVWVDVKDIEIITDGQGPKILDGAHPGLYNLLDFTNGKDTIIADAMIPAGTLSQIRLILGDNNFLVTNAGDTIALKTPSGQTSGLKVQVHQDMTGGILYRLVLDFDAGKSIVKAGNSGNFILKPVIRILSLVPSGGNIQGYVLPDSVRTLVLAIQGTDTVASSFSDPSAFGYWLIKDVPAGNYSLSFLPSDTTFQPEYRNAAVSLGQVTVVDTVKLHQ